MQPRKVIKIAALTWFVGSSIFGAVAQAGESRMQAIREHWDRERRSQERRESVDWQAWRLPARAQEPARAVQAVQRAPSPVSGDFWWHLANCESGVGRTSANIFQFMGGTENKVGYYPGASYEQQKAMAQNWASRISNPGSTAGWPVCWWRAKAATGGP